MTINASNMTACPLPSIPQEHPLSPLNTPTLSWWRLRDPYLKPVGISTISNTTNNQKYVIRFREKRKSVWKKTVSPPFRPSHHLSVLNETRALFMTINAQDKRIDSCATTSYQSGSKSAPLSQHMTYARRTPLKSSLISLPNNLPKYSLPSMP